VHLAGVRKPPYASTCRACYADCTNSDQNCESVTIRVPVDHRPACTGHPDAVALDAAIEIAAILVRLEEGLERVEERPAALVESSALIAL
jgi:hypothetical protein